MNSGELLRKELLKNTEVTALIGTRMYPLALPQEPTLPAVVYTIISSVPANSYTNTVDSTAEEARVQVDVYGETYKSVHEVAAVIDAAVLGLTGPDISAIRESTQDLYEDDTRFFRVMSDYIVLT